MIYRLFKQFFRKKILNEIKEKGGFEIGLEIIEESFLYKLELIHTLPRELHSSCYDTKFNGLRGDLEKCLSSIIFTSSKFEKELGIEKFGGVCNISEAFPYPYKNLEEYAFSCLKGLDEAPKDRLQTWIRCETDDDLERNKKDVLAYARPMNVVHQTWNNKYFAGLPDCNHRFSAIYRQCRTQQRDFVLRCRVREESINQDVAQNILNTYHSIVINPHSYEILRNTLEKYKINYFYGYYGEKIHSWRIKYYDKHQLSMSMIFLFFPKRDPLAEDIYNLLINKRQYVYDFSAYLRKLTQA